MEITFTEKLMEWHDKENKRIMPWKGEKDPYKIWISEIILQQTRVKQGLAYYNNFIVKFSTIDTLASAKDEDVFKAWEGLGYYTRCRNILVTARFIKNELKGIFPDQYEKILNLKGIGPYTAAAISSFAYGLPHAVVDGNVFRVLARFFGEQLPIDTPAGKKHFTDLANQLLDVRDTASYNQAIMDFGATVCKPQIPECQSCVLRSNCIAYKKGLVNKLPVKEKQLKRRNRYFTYFIFRIKEGVLVNRRKEKDIWQGLYEFYLFETDEDYVWNKLLISKFLNKQLAIDEYDIKHVSETFTQQLTHQNLKGISIIVDLTEKPAALHDYTLVQIQELSLLSFPKYINQYLQSHPL